MNGKVHSVVGITACTFIMQPRNLEELLVCALTGAIGGLLPDIDIRNSEARQELKEVSACGAVAGGIMVLYMLTHGFSIINFLHNIDMFKLIVLAILAINIMIGLMSGHRKYTHSIEFALVTVLCIFCLTHNIIISVGLLIGIISHDLVDTLNKKKVLLSCILKIKICFNVCAADSNLANMLGMLAGALLVVYCGLTRIFL